MNADKLIASEQTVTLAGIVAADLISQGPSRTFPKPRRILAVFLFYGALSLIASFGEGPARFAAAAGAVTTLAALVLGATGGSLVSLLRRGTGLLSTAGNSSAQPSQSGSPLVAPPANPIDPRFHIPAPYPGAPAGRAGRQAPAITI